MRVTELIDAFGADRVMMGSDYPFGALDVGVGNELPAASAVNKDTYFASVNLPLAWKLPLSKRNFALITRGNAERLYGKFGGIKPVSGSG